MPSNALELQGVAHSYEDDLVFEDIELAVHRGELVALLGASGSGKTTLLRAVAGFVTPNRGAIWINGLEVAHSGLERVPPERRGVGLVFQDYALFPHMSVFENVAFGLQQDANTRSRVLELLDLLRLEPLQTRRPSALSGGQQQRVALARALAPRPSLLLLDEPFANLDGPLRYEVARQVTEILEHEGIGALLVTHDQEEALGLASRVAVLAKLGQGPARLLQVGTAQEVYEAPATAEVASLTGRVSFLTEGPDRLQAVRPHEAQFLLGAEGDCEVLRRRFFGSGWEIQIKTPRGNVILDQATDTPPDIGSRGRLEIFSNIQVPQKGQIIPNEAK